MARLLSPTYGTYFMTTQWSGCSPGWYSSGLEDTMSSTTLDLEISCSGSVQCAQLGQDFSGVNKQEVMDTGRS